MPKLNASLEGRLRNTSLPQSKFLFPIFEAVVNSIYSIDDRIDNDKTFSLNSAYIKIQILREDQATFFGNEKGNVKEVVITDNGIGFTDDNYESFCTLDSMYHVSKGCRGIGRLLWLKEFSFVKVISTYKNKNGKLFKRSFDFSSKEGIENDKEDNVLHEKEPITEIHLLSPKKLYSDLFQNHSLDRISKE